MLTTCRLDLAAEIAHNQNGIFPSALSASASKHHFGLTGPLRFPTRPLFMLMGRFPDANEFYGSALAFFLSFQRIASE